MKITIYTMTHKKFQVPPDPMYQPLQVGSAGHGNLGYLRDDSGDNISKWNCYYSELTGFYWNIMRSRGAENFSRWYE